MRARQDSIWPERAVKVECTDTGLSSAYPNGETQQIAWGEVTRILVQTNDMGPGGTDVWWVVEGERATCAFPQGATGDDEALKEFHRRFPSFEVKGMNSTSNARFVCWPRWPGTTGGDDDNGNRDIHAARPASRPVRQV